MKIIIRTHNWNLPWQAILPEYLALKGHSVVTTNGKGKKHDPDLVIHMWSDGSSKPEEYPDAKHIFYMRRFDFFYPEWRKLNWNKIDHLIFVNNIFKEAVDDWLKEHSLKVPTSLIYNYVDIDKWIYKPEKERTYNIGMACNIHLKKNVPLAIQILNALPEKYSLHLAGAMQDNCLLEYLNHIAIQTRRRFYYYDKLPRENLDSWWDMMDCCLSTSISEGNPNNIIEAMAKGIKPVVHNWPGAKDQFHEHYIFDTIDDAVMIINSDFNKPEQHRDWVKERYSLDNLDKIYEVIEGVCG